MAATAFTRVIASAEKISVLAILVGAEAAVIPVLAGPGVARLLVLGMVAVVVLGVVVVLVFVSVVVPVIVLVVGYHRVLALVIIMVAVVVVVVVAVRVLLLRTVLDLDDRRLLFIIAKHVVGSGPRVLWPDRGHVRERQGMMPVRAKFIGVEAGLVVVHEPCIAAMVRLLVPHPAHTHSLVWIKGAICGRHGGKEGRGEGADQGCVVHCGCCVEIQYMGWGGVR